MKILMATMAMDIGGAETHIMELAKCLALQGHTVLIASNGGVYADMLEQYGIRHCKIPMNRRSGKEMFQSLGLLEKLIREEKPDIVHAHARIPAMLCGILEKKYRFPFITTAHWVFAVTPLLRKVTNWGKRTMAVSEDIRLYLRENYGIPDEQIDVTVNGINTEEYAPGRDSAALKAELGIGNGPVVGLVSRLDASRAVAAETLIDIAQDLAKAIPEVTLLIVGGGDRERELRKKADAINKTAGRTLILMTGARTDVQALISCMDVFVGVSRAALEAMSSGVPTILAGNEGYCGLYTMEKLKGCQESNFCCREGVEITKEALLRDLLDVMIKDSTEREKIGLAGRQTVIDHYSVSRMTADYLRAYDLLLHPEQRLRAVISGYYGYHNLGDDALLLAVSRELKKLPAAVTVLSKEPGETLWNYGLRAVKRFQPTAVTRAIRKSDFVISGGGSLLQDRTSTRSLLYYLTIIRLARHYKKPIFLYANGIGPVEKPRNRKRVKKVLDACECITLRDQDSFAELRRLGIGTEKAFVTGDPAFLLEAGAQREGKALPFPAEGKYIGISVRRTADAEKLTETIAKLCDRIAEEFDYGIVFLAMQSPQDADLSRSIMEKMRNQAWLCDIPGDPEQMLRAVGKMEAVLSMRLHTIIFAAEQCVPSIGCVYDPKITAYLDQLNLPSCGKPEELDADSIFAQLQELLERREEYAARLEEKTQEMRIQAEESSRLLRAYLKTKGLLSD